MYADEFAFIESFIYEKQVIFYLIIQNNTRAITQHKKKTGAWQIDKCSWDNSSSSIASLVGECRAPGVHDRRRRIGRGRRRPRTSWFVRSCSAAFAQRVHEIFRRDGVCGCFLCCWRGWAEYRSSRGCFGCCWRGCAGRTNW